MSSGGGGRAQGGGLPGQQGDASLGDGGRERIHEGRAGEGSAECHWLQMQLVDEQTASQCCREQALQFPMAHPNASAIYHARTALG